MSHGILESDRGYVWGTTWHGLDQYKRLEVAVTMAQALEVLDYPLEKRQLYRRVPEASFRTLKPANAWEVVRTDTKPEPVTLVDHVGPDFTPVGNGNMLRWIDEHLLAQYSDLKIESVGTLFGGATAFVNLVVGEFHVKGDTSQTLCRLMYYNPLGRGSYRACAHGVRVVCNNTLRMAEAQGAAEKTLMKVRHTAGAANAINKHLVELADVRLGLKAWHAKLDTLAGLKMTPVEAQDFLNKLLPTDKDASERSVTRVANQHTAIMDLFEGGNEALEKAIARSRYAMLNAVTGWLDHGKTSETKDAASIQWDGMVGGRADTKDRALALLTPQTANLPG